MLLLLAPAAWIVGGRLDRKRRTTTWQYVLESKAGPWQQLGEAFDGLAGCQGRWRILSGASVSDRAQWKRHAGARHLIRRQPIALERALPELLDCNIEPPALLMPGLALYLLPDILLVDDHAGFAGIAYADLDLGWEASPFIEEGPAPADSEVTGHQWAHTNQDGGPDQRFRDNRQLPVCRYGALRMRSHGGIDLLLQFSRPECVQGFVDAMRAMAGNKPDTLFTTMLREAQARADAKPMIGKASS